MKKCEWCGKPSVKLNQAMSLGTMYSVCDKCFKAHTDEVCIICGDPVVGTSVKGKCLSCSQEEYEEKQRKAEEMAIGVDSSLLEIYATGVEFTEADYERWVTFGQGNFTPEYARQCKRNWLRNKLVNQGGWDPAIVDSKMDAIESLMDKYTSSIFDGKYVLVYYDGKNTKNRIRQFISKVDNIFLIERPR